jgi:hypothetical protein
MGGLMDQLILGHTGFELLNHTWPKPTGTLAPVEFWRKQEDFLDKYKQGYDALLDREKR